jgi:hypothetical protein
LTGLDAYTKEEDGDREADQDCCYSVEELAKPPEVECSWYMFRRDVINMATCSIMDPG